MRSLKEGVKRGNALDWVVVMRAGGELVFDKFELGLNFFLSFIHGLER